MKMKELNFWLALGGFFQLSFLACVGAFVNEMLKDDRSIFLLVASIFFGVIAGCFGVAVYLKIYNEIPKHNE